MRISSHYQMSRILRNSIFLPKQSLCASSLKMRVKRLSWGRGDSADASFLFILVAVWNWRGVKLAKREGGTAWKKWEIDVGVRRGKRPLSGRTNLNECYTRTESVCSNLTRQISGFAHFSPFCDLFIHKIFLLVYVRTFRIADVYPYTHTHTARTHTSWIISRSFLAVSSRDEYSPATVAAFSLNL